MLAARMDRWQARAAVVVAGVIVAVNGCAKAPTPPSAEEMAAAQVERGRYLVAVTGCGDCHTPMTMGANGPEPDLARALSGHPEGVVADVAPSLGDGPWVWAGTASNTAFAGPWGISYAANLTSDEESGLGVWTEEMFIAALRNGKQFGHGRPLLPPMPWPAYAQLSDADLEAMYAYLRTLPPVVNHVPAWKPPQPAS